MRGVKTITIFGAILALSGLVDLPTVVAQSSESPSAEQTAAARAAYGRGTAEFDAGNYEAAEAAFWEAYELIPNPIVLVGVAQSMQRRGELQGAVSTLQRYLAERPDAPDRERWETTMQEMLQTAGTLVVSSLPAGASLSIGGEPHEGVTPAEIDLPPGEYTVMVSREGYLESRETVVIEYGSRYDHEVALVSEDEANGTGAFGVGDGLGDDGETLDDGDSTGGGVSRGTLVWVASGISGAALVTGTVLGFLALSEQSEFDQTPSNEIADRGERFALMSDISLGVAAAAAVTGLVLYFGDGDDDADAASNARTGGAQVNVVPAFGPNGASIHAAVAF